MLCSRKRFGKISKKLGSRFSKLPLKPNHWTMLSIIVAAIAAYFVVQHEFVFGAALFLAAGFFDAVDGAVARHRNIATARGAYLDTITDRYVEFIIIFALFFVSAPAFYAPFQAWLFLYLFGSLMTTYSKAAAKEKELAILELRGGILERPERVVLLFFGILLSAISLQYLAAIIVLLAVLANITALQRIFKALAQ